MSKRIIGILSFLLVYSTIHRISAQQYHEMLPFTEGMAPVRLGSRWGFVDTNGILIVRVKYDRVNPFFYGLAEVWRNGHHLFVDKKGNELQLAEDSIEHNSEIHFYYGCNFFYNNGLVGIYVDDKQIAPPVYSSVFSYNCSSPTVFGVTQNGYYGILNEKGEVTVPLTYQYIQSFYLNGVDNFSHITAKKNEKFGAIDIYGREVIPFIFDTIWPFEGNRLYTLAKLDQQIVMIDTNGRYSILEPIKPVINHLIAFQQDGKWGYLSKEGDTIVPGIYDTVQYKLSSEFFMGYSTVVHNGKFGLIDTTGQLVIKPMYQNIAGWNEHSICVEYNNLFGYIDFEGKILIDYRFFGAHAFIDSTARVYNEKKWRWTLINLSGKRVAGYYKDLYYLPALRQYMGKREHGKWTDVYSYIDTYTGNVLKRERIHHENPNACTWPFIIAIPSW